MYGKSNKQIAKEIIEFVNPGLGWPAHSYNNSELRDGKPLSDYFNLHNVKAFDFEGLCDYFFAQPTFYAYYADYDWVVFCSLFGTMMQLPTGFPMYCRDLKQMVDEWCEKARPTFESLRGGIPHTFDDALKELKNDAHYPKETNEHHALADAKFAFELYKFLQS